MTIRIKRVYDTPSPQDGKRVLVDRLWPRGLTKEQAHIDTWLKDIAPSNELRQWFNHDADKWDEFVRKYTAEISANHAAFTELRELTDRPITLVYAAKDERHNNAVVLQSLLS